MILSPQNGTGTVFARPEKTILVAIESIVTECVVPCDRVHALSPLPSTDKFATLCRHHEVVRFLTAKSPTFSATALRPLSMLCTEQAKASKRVCNAGSSKAGLEGSAMRQSNLALGSPNRNKYESSPSSCSTRRRWSALWPSDS